MNKKILYILLSLILVSTSLHSQYLEEFKEEETKPEFKDRIFYSGNLSLSFGTNTFVNINPSIGYRITNRLSAGIGGNYYYISSRIYDYSYNFWGGHAMASYTIVTELSDIMPFMGKGESLLIHGEYIMLNMETYFSDYGMKQKWQATPLLGLAYQSRIGARSFIIFSVLYNFNESAASIYSNPVIRVSFQF